MTKNVFLSQYLFIAILCVRMSRVNKALSWLARCAFIPKTEDFFVEHYFALLFSSKPETKVSYFCWRSFNVTTEKKKRNLPSIAAKSSSGHPLQEDEENCANPPKHEIYYLITRTDVHTHTQTLNTHTTHIFTQGHKQTHRQEREKETVTHTHKHTP